MNEILLNKMYVGEYLKNQDNIGHEIINLFKADNDKNYIYVNYYGAMAKEHNNKIKTILLVRYCTDCTMEILAKAADLEQVVFVNTTFPSEKQKIHKDQIKYIDKNDIKYDGLKPYDIFTNNKDNENAAYITFKANTLLKPVKPIYICANGSKKYKEKESCYYLGDKYTFSKSSLKMYVCRNKHWEAYQVLEDIINNNSLWENKNSTKSVSKGGFSNKEKNCFLKIIDKEYSENIFSNLFKYVFDYDKELFPKFVTEVLDIGNFEKTCRIQREYPCYDNKKLCGRIDLFVESEKQVIIIENKIKSGINGCCDKYDKQTKNQLDLYFKFIENEYKDKDKERHYFIFVPNYNNIDIPNYDCTNSYKKINYSEIHKWFSDNSGLYEKCEYFEEFLNGLNKHTQNTDNSLEEEMYRRFYNKIQEFSKRKTSFRKRYYSQKKTMCRSGKRLWSDKMEYRI